MRWALSLVLLGFVAVVVGAGTFAYFSDTEESTGNYIAAGTLDLKVNDKDNVGTVFEVSNLKPGDSGSQKFTLKNTGSLGGLLDITVTMDDQENGQNEPEQQAGDTSGDEGELCQYVKVWLDVNDDGQFTDGTDIDVTNGYQNYTLNADGEIDLYVSWDIDNTVGNEIQSDKCVIDLTFYLEQQ